MDVGLTSGGSLKRLSRKRPRLNSISRAEPLATVTRLRWFRENMLMTPRVYLLGAFPEPPGCAWSSPPLSLDARSPVRPGSSRSPVSKLRPRRRHLGRAGRGTLLLHPRQRPGRPGQSWGAKQAWPDNPTTRHPTPLEPCGGAPSGRAPGSGASPGQGAGPGKPRPAAVPTWQAALPARGKSLGRRNSRVAQCGSGRALGPRPVAPPSSFRNDHLNFLQSQMSLLRPPPALSSPCTAAYTSTQLVGQCLSTSCNPVLSLTYLGASTQSLNFLSFSFSHRFNGEYSDYLLPSGCYEDYIRE